MNKKFPGNWYRILFVVNAKADTYSEALENTRKNMRSITCINHELQVKPGPQATTWEEDYAFGRYWFARTLEVWNAIPLRFRGPVTLEEGGPRTLTDKIKAMEQRINELEAVVAPLAGNNKGVALVWGSDLQSRINKVMEKVRQGRENQK